MDGSGLGEARIGGPAQAEQRLVLLHGWGADAGDLFELGELLVGPEVSVVALQAPLPHPAGSGRQWYDLQQPGWPQLPGALHDLRRRLAVLQQSVPLQRTVVLGFSQGAAMAIHAVTGGALTSSGCGGGSASGSGSGSGSGGLDPTLDQGLKPGLEVGFDGAAIEVAGLVGCSGYPHPEWHPGAGLLEGLNTKVLLTHGEQDPVVPHGASIELERLLVEAGAQVELLSFNGGHTIEPGLFEPIRTFMTTCWSS